MLLAKTNVIPPNAILPELPVSEHVAHVSEHVAHVSEHVAHVSEHVPGRNAIKEMLDEVAILHHGIAEARKRITHLEGEIKRQCPHDEVKVVTENIPGDYYNRSVTEYWNVCRVCGMRTMTRQELGYYG